MAFASFLLPLGLLGMPNARDDSGALGLMWLEANAWSQGLCTVTKVIAQRTRPYVYDPDAPADKKTRPNARLSYFSGHTVAAATNSFFVATVFSDYSSNHSAEVAVWSSAVLYSALTGFFRVDSGHHFTTDVLTGFAIGATAGYLVPRFHRRNHDDVSVNPGSPGAALGVTVTFAF
jgi:membrane-associated phospholipid phosphatase